MPTILRSGRKAMPRLPFPRASPRRGRRLKCGASAGAREGALATAGGEGDETIIRKGAAAPLARAEGEPAAPADRGRGRAMGHLPYLFVLQQHDHPRDG